MLLSAITIANCINLSVFLVMWPVCRCTRTRSRWWRRVWTATTCVSWRTVRPAPGRRSRCRDQATTQESTSGIHQLSADTHTHAHTHTHTHPFNGPFSGTTQVSRYQKGKTSLDFTKARDSEWQWHQLGHMQVCISLQPDNHTSTSLLSSLQAGCPSCRPTNSVKALKA